MDRILRAIGLKKGDARFTEFCKILFLRLITFQEQNISLWQNILNSNAANIIENINHNLKKLNRKYEIARYGKKLKFNNNRVVRKIVDKLDKIDFNNTSLDVKGSAFEFFLGYKSKNDDLAQYFTPRNIIRFMCDLIKPLPGEKIYDPFCGSGGILINVFDYVKKQLIPNDPQYNTHLKALKEKSIFGTDINEIAYVAKMNMILV